MKPYTFSELIVKFLLGCIFGRPDTQKIKAFGEIVEVENPISFHELDERYGKGNWSLIARG